MFDYKLYYTIENILKELTNIIVNEKNLPDIIIDSYTELNEMSLIVETLPTKTGMTPNELIVEINEIYQDIIDEYIIYLEVKASHIYE